LWEKDNEIESLRKHLEAKSGVPTSLATNHPVFTGHSSGATNVSWPITVHLHRNTLMTYQYTLDQHVTTPGGGFVIAPVRLPYVPPNN